MEGSPGEQPGSAPPASPEGDNSQPPGEEGQPQEQAPPQGEVLHGDERLEVIETDDGEELEVPLGELKRGYLLARMAGKATVEANALKDRVLSIFKKVEDSPMDGLVDFFSRKLKGDEDGAYQHVLKAAGKFLSDWKKLRDASPAERENIQLKRQLDRMETETKAERERREGERFRQESLENAEALSAEVKPAMQAAGLALTERNYGMVARVLTRCQAAYLQTNNPRYRVSADKAVKLIQQHLERERDAGLSPEALPAEEVLRRRPDVEELVHKRTVEKVSAETSRRTQPRTPLAAPGKKEPPKARIYSDSPFEHRKATSKT